MAIRVRVRADCPLERGRGSTRPSSIGSPKEIAPLPIAINKIHRTRRCIAVDTIRIIYEY
jgi:hypothetical protein